jgi:hypothetical protein
MICLTVIVVAGLAAVSLIALGQWAEGGGNNFDLYRFDGPAPLVGRMLTPEERYEALGKKTPTPPIVLGIDQTVEIVNIPQSRKHRAERYFINGVPFSVDTRLIEKWEKENVQ